MSNTDTTDRIIITATTTIAERNRLYHFEWFSHERFLMNLLQGSLQELWAFSPVRL